MSAFLWVKGSQDILVVIVVLIGLIFIGEKWFLNLNNMKDEK